jgi:L-lactate dehydrogenase
MAGSKDVPAQGTPVAVSGEPCLEEGLAPRALHRAMSERRVVVVGTGRVGMTFAYALMQSGLADEIVLVGRSRDKVEAEAEDMSHGLLFVPSVTVRGGDYGDCAGADIVVVAAGAAQKEGESRIDLARRNADIFREMIPRIAAAGPEMLLVVTNPVDVLTYVAQKISGLAAGRVIGSGTVLDSARLRFLLSRHCGVATRNVHGYILGEHGDSEVPAWSTVSLGGVPITSHCPSCGKGCSQEDLDGIFEQVRTAAYKIIAGKGATYYGIGLALVRIAEAVLRSERSILTVSTLVSGRYGIEDVCLSVPVIVDSGGVVRELELELPGEELHRLRASAALLAKVQRQVGF